MEAALRKQTAEGKMLALPREFFQALMETEETE